MESSPGPGSIRGLFRPAILALALAAGLPVFAASHPQLDQAIDRLHDLQALSSPPDLAKARNLLSQAIVLVRGEPVGPEWQGHRQAAVALLQALLDTTWQHDGPPDLGSQVQAALAELNAAVADADNFVPPPPPTALDSLNLSEDPDLLKISYVEDASAQPYPTGTRFGSGPVMATADPNDVLQGKPVYFQMGSGNSVHYNVTSGRPLTKLVFTGMAFMTATIEIKDAQGHPITGAGPFEEGNVEKTITIPLPRLTAFEVVFTSYAKKWFLIQDLYFEPRPNEPPAAP